MAPASVLHGSIRCFGWIQRLLRGGGGGTAEGWEISVDQQPNRVYHECAHGREGLFWKLWETYGVAQSCHAMPSRFIWCDQSLDSRCLFLFIYMCPVCKIHEKIYFSISCLFRLFSIRQAKRHIEASSAKLCMMMSSQNIVFTCIMHDRTPTLPGQPASSIDE
eukprot:COSAG05_NODE_7546_length_798_cov_1.201717_1_plen_163_part_00